MNDFHDPRLAAVERRLERRLPAEPSPALRHRVLMAADDALAEKVPATKSADSAPDRWGACPDLVAGTFSWAFAAAVAMVVTVSVAAGVAPLRHYSSPSLAARLRAAGVTDDKLLDLAASPPAADAPPRDQTGLPRPVHPAVRLIEVRKLLEEHL